MIGEIKMSEILGVWALLLLYFSETISNSSRSL